MKIKSIAFYLPQYHPIPENDKWWGKGFTEWTNVTKAKPLYEGHYQPHLPADLGFYDLRISEVRELQAEMAKKYGIHAFCFWHYWFGSKKRILERPFNEILKSGTPDFPFCLAWANESWTGIWHGLSDNILIEQTYPGDDDFIDHFYAVLPALFDKRYVRKNNKPIFIVYKPFSFDYKRFITLWSDLAVKEGLDGIYFISVGDIDSENIYQEYIPAAPGAQIDYISNNQKNKKVSFITKYLNTRNSHKPTLPKRIKFQDYIEFEKSRIISSKEIPLILTGWDNTPRSGNRGYVIEDYTPTAFKVHCSNVLDKVLYKNGYENFIFIKSWNEWGEGNYLEPDIKYGSHFLEAFKDVFYNYI